MQHFLLSPQARTLDFSKIYSLTEEEAHSQFVKIRFSDNGGNPYCPACGGTKVYAISTRRTWRCAATECKRVFSATSYTVFADRKLPFRSILLAVAYFVNEPKGLEAIRLSHVLGISYKSAFVLEQKLREVLSHHQENLRLGGEVEVDGGYFGGYVKPGNEHPSRRGRRRLNRNPAKQKCVVVARERYGRSRTMICSEVEGAKRLHEIVEDGSIVFTDKFSGSAPITARFQHFRVNHSQQYADGWVSTNWAESFFSRMRRMEIGSHHHIAGAYIRHYANEASWREDLRRVSNGEKFGMLLELAAHHPVSRSLKGYWQRRKAGES